VVVLLPVVFREDAHGGAASGGGCLDLRHGDWRALSSLTVEALKKLPFHWWRWDADGSLWRHAADQPRNLACAICCRCIRSCSFCWQR